MSSADAMIGDAAIYPAQRWEVRSGRSAVLLIAPHGGRRPPVDPHAPPPRLRVNDVFTPELTRILATQLDATAIINSHTDRNRLDLNRISQVRRHAADWLALITEQLAEILARHATAEVVFVHGWNTGQPKCDIGIGVRLGDVDPPAAAPTLTVSAAYVATRIAALRAACDRAGICAPIGERYSGRHHNNLLQLFARAHSDDDDPHAGRICGWVRDGRIDATQLELGIPIRWPGSWRDRFVEAMTRSFTASRSDGRTVVSIPSGSKSDDRSSESAAPMALQFYDPAADIGLFAGTGPLDAHTLGGRLLLFLGGQRIALFTGEEATATSASVAPLAFHRDAEGVRLQFAGTMLRVEDAAHYVDLEAAFAQSQLIDVDLDLSFHRRHAPSADGAEFGWAAGAGCIAGRRVRIHAGAFANAGGWRAAGLRRHTMLAAVFADRQAVLARGSDAAHGNTAIGFDASGARPLFESAIEIQTDGDAYTPARVRIAANGAAPIDAAPISRMAILRPAGDGYLRVTFGVAACRWGDRIGSGLYEYAQPLATVD